MMAGWWPSQHNRTATFCSHWPSRWADYGFGVVTRRYAPHLSAALLSLLSAGHDGRGARPAGRRRRRGQRAGQVDRAGHRHRVRGALEPGRERAEAVARAGGGQARVRAPDVLHAAAVAHGPRARGAGRHRRLRGAGLRPAGAGGCVESDAGQYQYKICFFGKATQDHTKLGDMEDFEKPKPSDDEGSADDASASVDPVVEEIKFSNGQKCWNGPNRSLTVKLECGPEPMELFNIEEPSTCVYSAKLRTPAVCSEGDRERIMKFDSATVTPHHIEIEVPATL
ncbi:hypothetical protein ON010_g2406 [Phytophthora cinnamomi]|nr:hypothetical protein ON010_g2406 [Phytophthora cinnamomi]